MTGSSVRKSSDSEPPRLALGPGELHLWLCPYTRDEGSASCLRSVLSRYAGPAPGAWRFGAGEHGKPHIENPGIALQFNLSHSGDWLLLGLSSGTVLGVDLERVDARRDTLRLARRFFAAPELAALEALSSPDRVDRFFDYWTLKEAVVKSRGAALAPELRRCEFELEGVAGDAPGRIRARFRGAGRLRLFEPLAGYRAALCWQGPREPEVTLYSPSEGGALQRSTPRWRAVGP